MTDRTFTSENGAHGDHVRETVNSVSAAATSQVAASWARSLNHHGLKPEAKGYAQRVDASSLRLRKEKLGRMLSVATPIMDKLYNGLALAGCSVFISDTDGVVLDHRSGASDEDVFQSAGLWAGGVWSEAVEGTNGIGTCIAEERPVTIFKDQHFRDCNTMMSCMGAPVFNETGRVAAVLDISSCRSDLTEPFAKLISQTVRDAARQIEADHFQAAFAQSRVVRAPGDGQRGAMLLAVDRDDLLVGATRSARNIYGLTDESFASPRPAGDILGDTSTRGAGLESAERRELKRALARAGGNVSRAARELGIGRATLYRRMERLGLTETK